MTLLAIDPGKTIGWALFHGKTGAELGRGTFQYEEIRERFDLALWGLYFTQADEELGTRYSLVSSIAIEDYIGRPGQKNGGQRFWGPESLAKIELLGELAGVEVKRQRAVDVLKVAALQAGYTLPKGHLPDEDSAWLHGRYRLTELGILKAEPLDS